MEIKNVICILSKKIDLYKFNHCLKKKTVYLCTSILIPFKTFRYLYYTPAFFLTDWAMSFTSDFVQSYNTILILWNYQLKLKQPIFISSIYISIPIDVNIDKLSKLYKNTLFIIIYNKPNRPNHKSGTYLNRKVYSKIIFCYFLYGAAHGVNVIWYKIRLSFPKRVAFINIHSIIKKLLKGITSYCGIQTTKPKALANKRPSPNLGTSELLRNAQTDDNR